MSSRNCSISRRSAASRAPSASSALGPGSTTCAPSSQGCWVYSVPPLPSSQRKICACALVASARASARVRMKRFMRASVRSLHHSPVEQGHVPVTAKDGRTIPEIATGGPSMRRLLFPAFMALALAALLAWLWVPQTVEQRVLAVQVERLMPAQAGELLDEALEVQAVFVDYAGAEDAVLATKAWLALRRYPDMARTILPLYGDDPLFRDILRRHGEAVLPPIRYFMDHDIGTLTLRKRTSDAIDALRWRWNGEAIPAPPPTDLTPVERGRYAIDFIATDGHGFLGQFEVAEDGLVSWIQTERALEGLASFFAGGIRGLETRVRSDEAVRLADLGWAAVDVAIGISALKVLRLGRGAGGAARVGFAER